MRDRGRDPKHQNIEVAGHRQRKIGRGSAAEITFIYLSSFTNTSTLISTMRGE
jgi:hypothetical protein